MDPDLTGKIIGYIVLGFSAMWGVISSRRSKKAAEQAEESALSVQEKAETIDELKIQVRQLEERTNFQDQKIAFLETANSVTSNNFEQAKKLLDDVQQERDMLQQKNGQLEEDKKVLEEQLRAADKSKADYVRQLEAEIKENDRLREEIGRLNEALENQAKRITFLTASYNGSGQTEN